MQTERDRGVSRRKAETKNRRHALITVENSSYGQRERISYDFASLC